MQCPATSRQTWRQKLLKSINRSGNRTTQDPFLLDILRDGLQRWLGDDNPLQLTQYPQAYHRLITNQNQIGWAHLFRGRWSSEWRKMHTNYICDHSSDNSLSGTTWVTLKGQQLLETWFTLWETRNLERHGRDEQERQAKRANLIRSQLEELYKLKSKVLPAHRRLFLTDAKTHFEMTTVLDSLDDWISTFGPAIQASATQAHSIPFYFGNSHHQ